MEHISFSVNPGPIPRALTSLVSCPAKGTDPDPSMSFRVGPASFWLVTLGKLFNLLEPQFLNL